MFFRNHFLIAVSIYLLSSQANAQGFHEYIIGEEPIDVLRMLVDLPSVRLTRLMAPGNQTIGNYFLKNIVIGNQRMETFILQNLSLKQNRWQVLMKGVIVD